VEVGFLYGFRVHFNHTLIGLFFLRVAHWRTVTVSIACIPAELADRGVQVASHYDLDGEKDLELIDELTLTLRGTDTLSATFFPHSSPLRDALFQERFTSTTALLFGIYFTSPR